MRSLYVVTHPEATHHLDGRVGGWYDSTLTERGLQQAAAIASQLRASIPGDVTPFVVASDLRRTMQTAASIAAAFRVTAEPCADLREKSYGEAEGRSQQWLERRFVLPPKRGDRMDYNDGLHGSETKRAWIDRAYRAVASLECQPFEHQIVVTHGGTASWVITAWMGISPESCSYARFETPSGSITHLVEDDRFHNRSLISLGSTEHLT